MKGEAELIDELKQIVKKDKHISYKVSRSVIKILNNRLREVLE